MKKYFAVATIIISIALPFAADAAITLVQSTSTLVNNASQTLKFATNPTVNNLIVAAAGWGSGTGSMTCSDTAGNTYATSTANHSVGHGQSAQICYAVVTVSGVSSDTVKANLPNGTFNMFAIHEFSGTATTNPLDVAQVNDCNQGVSCAVTTSTDNVNSVPNASSAVATTQNGDLIFGWVLDDSGAATITKGSAFTQAEYQSSYPGMTEYRVQPTSGAVSTTFTFSIAHDYLDNMATFKAAPAAAARKIRAIGISR